MPELLLKRIRKMRTFAVLQLAVFVLMILLLGILLQCVLATISSAVCIGLLLAIVFCCAVIIFCTKYQNRKESLPEYVIPVKTSDLQAVIDSLNMVSVESNSYVSFLKMGRVSVRILMQYCDTFDEKTVKSQRKYANKLVNKKSNVSVWMPIHRALSMVRINLVVCDQGNEELQKWVGRRTTMLLHRTEAIVSAAVILNERKLLFPACMDDLSISELSRYEACAQLLVDRLGCLRNESAEE